MKKTIRKFAVLGTAVAATTAAQAGPLAGNTFAGKTFHDTSALAGPAAPLILAAGSGGEAGEGVGTGVDADLMFHVGVGEVAGKMIAAATLYEQGQAEAAKGHMVRPSDDIYTALKPMLAEFNMPGFAAELTALADAIDAGAPAAEVKSKLAALTAATQENGAPEAPHELALTVVHLVRNAGGDYANGVTDGKVTDAHEYQDAWGYVQAAKRLLGGAPDFMREEYGKEFEKISAYLDGLDSAWPDLTGEKPAGAESSVIAGTAARIELVSLHMD
jgi:hypothetical protein